MKARQATEKSPSSHCVPKDTAGFPEAHHTSRHQNCETIHFCCLSTQDAVLCYGSPSKLTEPGTQVMQAMLISSPFLCTRLTHKLFLWGFTMLASLVSISWPQAIHLPWLPKVLDYRPEPLRPATGKHFNLSHLINSRCTFSPHVDISEMGMCLSRMYPQSPPRGAHLESTRHGTQGSEANCLMTSEGHVIPVPSFAKTPALSSVKWGS
ncbi:hypothetical protein AAY473_035167 [Plecturocebus cupreus]